MIKKSRNGWETNKNDEGKAINKTTSKRAEPGTQIKKSLALISHARLDGWVERVPKAEHICRSVMLTHPFFDVLRKCILLKNFLSMWWETRKHENRYRAEGFDRRTQAETRVSIQFGSSVQTDSRNRFSLKFKTNWRRDKTRPRMKRCTFYFWTRRSSFRIFASEKLLAELPFNVFIFILSPQTHTKSRHNTHMSRIIWCCLDPQKHKNLSQNEKREGNEAKKKKNYKNNSLCNFNAVSSFASSSSWLLELVSRKQKQNSI